MKRSKKLVSVVAILLLGTCGITEGSLLRNVTSSVFGEDLPGGILPLAFGDFNSDKLTDLLVMTGTSTLSILLAKPQTFAMESGTYFNMETRTKGMQKVNRV